MNKNYTLKELADIGAKAANSCLPEGVRMCVLSGSPPHHVVARQAFTKAILDTIGYEFPKDAEREAFDVWWKENRIAFCNEEHAFQLWKAGREELRKEDCSDQCEDPKTEPAWIPWHGGDKSPIVEKQTKFEIKYRDGIMEIYNQRQNLPLDWEHCGKHYDIVAYRILD